MFPPVYAHSEPANTSRRVVQESSRAICVVNVGDVSTSDPYKLSPAEHAYAVPT